MNANNLSREHQARESADRIVRATGISRGLARSIADAAVRRRDVARLAIQKGWPVDWDCIEGPDGRLPLACI